MLGIHLNSLTCRSSLRLKLVGVTILVAGLGSASSIWLDQDRIDRESRADQSPAAEASAPEDSRRYARDVQLYYGETGLLVEKWKRWLSTLTRGKPLAYTIAGASLGLAGGLFYLAPRRNWPPEPPRPT
jgi:hypothetical protein